MIRTAIVAAALVSLTPAFAASNAPQPTAAQTALPAPTEAARIDVNSATVEQLAAAPQRQRKGGPRIPRWDAGPAPFDGSSAYFAPQRPTPLSVRRVSAYIDGAVSRGGYGDKRTPK